MTTQNLVVSDLKKWKKRKMFSKYSRTSRTQNEDRIDLVIFFLLIYSDETALLQK